MTAAQKTFIEVQKRQSSLRGEFNTLRGIETRSAEQDGRLTALDGELTDSEAAFQTAADALLTEQATPAATPTGEDTEAREKRELCERANVGSVYQAILEKRQTDGATAEAQGGARMRAESDPACHARGAHRGPRGDPDPWRVCDRTG